MVSYYLTPEASVKRLCALYNRLCAEAIDLGPCGGLTWTPESSFWLLPAKVQAEVIAWTMANKERNPDL